MNTYENYLINSSNTLPVEYAVSIYDELLLSLSKCKLDEDIEDLIKDFKVKAFAYAKTRIMWEFYTREEKIEKDETRTIQHNSLIDSINILARYIKNEGQDITWREDLGEDRKRIGDFACFVAYMLAVDNR